MSLVFAARSVATHPTSCPQSPPDQSTSRSKNGELSELSEKGLNIQQDSSADNQGEYVMAGGRGSHRSAGWCNLPHGPARREGAERGRKDRVVVNEVRHPACAVTRPQCQRSALLCIPQELGLGKGHSTIDGFVKGVNVMFEAYDTGTLERV